MLEANNGHREDEDDQNENREQPRSIQEEYAEATSIDEDEKDFMNYMLRMSKVEREMVMLSEDFHDGDIDPYQAKIKLLALFDIVVEMRDQLRKTV